VVLFFVFCFCFGVLPKKQKKGRVVGRGFGCLFVLWFFFFSVFQFSTEETNQNTFFFISPGFCLTDIEREKKTRSEK